MSRRRLALGLATAWSLGCAGNPGPAPLPTNPATATPAATLALLTALAHDSMEGRRTGEPGATRAATLIAAAMTRIGLVPAGDSGFFQRVPLGRTVRVINGREVPTAGLLPSLAARDSLHPSRRIPGFNVLGVVPGVDPSLAGEYLLVGAHYDHVGIRANETTDSVFNGADDDATGVVAVLSAAEQLKKGPAPRRTVVFAAWTGEEIGLLGARWYADHPARPLTEMVANLEVEMIGRPDSLAGGSGKAWLTGYERTTMGDLFAAERLPIGPDKRLSQNFFQRSDNYQFARRGIVAQTISSYNMHSDYHRPTDQVDRIDSVHLAATINAIARAVRILADGPNPAWKPGGRPAPAPSSNP